MDFKVDPKIRFLVLYRDAHFSIERINKITGTSVRTLRSWKQKLQGGQDIFNVQEGRGRKKKFLEYFRKIKNITMKKPQRASIRVSGAPFGISRTTTDRIFHELGFSQNKIIVKHKLTKVEKDNRLKFCQGLLQYPNEIKQSFWSDETGVWLSDCTKKKAWTLGGKLTYPAPIKDVKLNIWAGISFKGATSLYIYKENFDEILYLRILQERQKEIDGLFRGEYYYFHDAHPVHKSKLVNTWASTNNMSLNLLPAKASDLNPIENLWGWLKACAAKDFPKDEAALVRSLKRNWKKVNKDFLLPYMNSLYNRCKQCIERNGNYTDY